MDRTTHDDLASELARLRLWVDAAQDFGRLGLWERDLRDGSGRWDRHIFALYGLPETDGAPHYEAAVQRLHPDDRERVHDGFIATFAQPGRHETRFRIVRTDGRVVHVHSIWQVPATGHQVVGVLIDDTDSLTQARAHEQALRDRAAAERAARTQREFLSRVSHELRTPLNAVLGFTGLLLDETGEPLSEAQRRHLAHVRDAGHHLLGLVDELLKLGGDAPRKGADPAQSCDVAGVVEQTVDWLADRASAAGVQVCVSGHCPRLRGGEPAWRQVVRHLLTNAIQYNRRGGLVQVALRPTADPGWAELEVRDSGVGMSARQQRHLFEPFNRLGAERLGVAGTGLGLATVRQIVTALGGAVSVDSAPGRGTTVTLCVPRAGDDAADARDASDARIAPAAHGAAGDEIAHAPRGDADRAPPVPPDAAEQAPPVPPDAAEQAAPAPSDAADGAAPTLDVLYVEDNKVNALLVAEVLSRRPRLRLHLAASVAEAVELARRLRPALLLVDMHLPDGTGLDLLARLPLGEGRPAGACVALSADVMPKEIERALAAGFDAYWSKPIDVERFLADVDRLLTHSA
jgi:signal transduction histidine kinase/CheY-like chemotaxis protein